MANGYESGGYFVALVIMTCILLVEFEPSDIPLPLWIALSIAILATCAAALYNCRKAGVALTQQTAHGEMPPYCITTPSTPPRRDSPPTYTAATLDDLPPPTYDSVVRVTRPPTIVKQLESADYPPPFNSASDSVVCITSASSVI